MLAISYLIAVVSILAGTAAIYMALLRPFPVSWLHIQYFVRKPLAWGLLVAVVAIALADRSESTLLDAAYVAPILLTAFGVVLTYRMHQSIAFPAVDYPVTSDRPLDLPIADDMDVAIIEYEGETKAYPLDYVIHHHIVNDRFGQRIVSLTYCAMCRSVIPFDVTEIGPLFVGSFKRANMIVADRRTTTFFQQSTGESIIGRLHPKSLEMLPFQILTWKEVKALDPMPKIVAVTAHDFREFQLPIPGVWKKIMASDATPGLYASDRDNRFSARTRVIGLSGDGGSTPIVFLKSSLPSGRVYHDAKRGFVLVSQAGNVNAFRDQVSGLSLDLAISEGKIFDRGTGACWDIRGKALSGNKLGDLGALRVSDEYWFSWMFFHPTSELVEPVFT